MRKINELIERLPPELQDEVYDFAQFLLEKKTQPKQKKWNDKNYPLRDKPIRYDDPFGSVAEDDWELLK